MYFEKCGLSALILGSLSNDDDNENGKKAIGLDWQNNNFARASGFFEHFLTFVARLQRESAQFHVLSRRGTQDDNFLFPFLSYCGPKGLKQVI